MYYQAYLVALIYFIDMFSILLYFIMWLKVTIYYWVHISCLTFLEFRLINVFIVIIYTNILVVCVYIYHSLLIFVTESN